MVYQRKYERAIPIVLEGIGVPTVPLKVPIYGTESAFDAVDTDLVRPESHHGPATLMGGEYGSVLVVGLPLP